MDEQFDRFPNQGKQSGAFSSGSFDGQPYILMNYQPDVLDHVFTLAGSDPPGEDGDTLGSHGVSRDVPWT